MSTDGVAEISRNRTNLLRAYYPYKYVYISRLVVRLVTNISTSMTFKPCSARDKTALVTPWDFLKSLD